MRKSSHAGRAIAQLEAASHIDVLFLAKHLVEHVVLGIDVLDRLVAGQEM